MITEFKLPELGENIESGTIVKVLVQAGDAIGKDQSVLELETDKAVIEVPSPYSGTVKKVLVQEGQAAQVDQVIFTIDVEEGTTSKVRTPEPGVKAEESSQGQPVEVGKEVHEAPRTSAEPAQRAVAPTSQQTASHVSSVAAPASPSVRRLARELGVDINQVSGSGPEGRITDEDIKGFSRQVMEGAATLLPSGTVVTRLPDFSRWGPVERVAMSGVRRKTAEAMTYAWTTVPHVTQFDKADVTDLEQLRKRYEKRAEALGGKLTMTVMVLKVVASALKVFPRFNASADMTANELIYKKYYHIGVAVDTDRGLLVPVLRDVDKKNILELSNELTQAAENARNKKTSPEEMQGGTFTLTNLGGIGGTSFTPIVYAPQVAILGVARANMEPVFIDGQFQPRLMLPLCLSYDHRVIDGADGARFLRWIVEALQQPFLLALEG